MQKKPFGFKQFSVSQSKAAMKMTTDGVLLGAWANTNSAKHILDIGTGTGIIALMAAQKNMGAIIHAIDIDEDACIQASENFSQSPWGNCIKAMHTSLQKFSTDNLYDAIISNPPYFIDDLKTGNAQLDVARHGTSLSYEELTAAIGRLLTEHGKAFLAIPVFNFQLLQAKIAAHRLFVTAHTKVVAVEGKQPYLSLLQLEKTERELSESTITIKDKNRIFTSEYRELTKDFYLGF